jgi:hypothetical protein
VRFANGLGNLWGDSEFVSTASGVNTRTSVQVAAASEGDTIASVQVAV